MPDFWNVPATLAAVGASLKTVGLIKQGATVRTRPSIVRFTLGFNGTPGDNAMLSELRKITADGTGSAVTPEGTDSAAPASNLGAAENYTAEPTTGNILFEMPQAQRTSWVEAFDLVDGPKLPNTANAGYALRTLHASYTGAASGKISYIE